MKKLHDIEEAAWPTLGSHMVRKALKGRGNIQEKRPSRLAMTPDIMWLLKNKLAKSRLSLVKKRLIWAAACTLFVGSLRSGETLPSNKLVFVKGATLLNKHISKETRYIDGSNRSFLRLFLEAPKEDRTGRGVEVELFETVNFFCPVTALQKWKKATPNFLLKNEKKKSAIFCVWSQDTWMLQKVANILALSLPSDASK